MSDREPQRTLMSRSEAWMGARDSCSRRLRAIPRRRHALPFDLENTLHDSCLDEPTSYLVIADDRRPTRIERPPAPKAPPLRSRPVVERRRPAASRGPTEITTPLVDEAPNTFAIIMLFWSAALLALSAAIGIATLV